MKGHKLDITTIIALIGMLFFTACSNNRDEKRKQKQVLPIGKYVYMDSQQILHIKKRCLDMRITDEDAYFYSKPITFIDTSQITEKHLNSLCSWCVEDEHYSQLKDMVKRNEEIINYVPEPGWGKSNYNQVTDW